MKVSTSYPWELQFSALANVETVKRELLKYIKYTSGIQGLNSKPTFISPCYKILISNFNSQCSRFSQNWSY